MAFQGITSVRGDVTQLVEIEGSDLVGTKVKAPFAINPEVYVLPMDNVLPNKVRSLSFLKPSLNQTACKGNWCGNICAVGLP